MRHRVWHRWCPSTFSTLRRFNQFHVTSYIAPPGRNLSSPREGRHQLVQLRSKVTGKQNGNTLSIDNDTQLEPSKAKRQPLPPLTMAEARNKVAALRHRLLELEPLPPVWLETDGIHPSEERAALSRKTTELIHQVEKAVKKEIVRESGKHGRELSHFLGDALFILSSTPNGEGESSFRLCTKVLGLLRHWNLDVQPDHYNCAIVAAAREQHWKEAAGLFSIQIDPDAAGYIPMDMSLSNPVGLYSIARKTQNEGGAPVEHVMDAVLKMSMVSPMDQTKYVLAAGVALGLAGEWKSCIEYLQGSYNSERLGRSLLAATMYACILCSRHDEALKLYREAVDDHLLTESEWQWGGGSDTLGPLIRDLAMRASGGSTQENGTTSSLAMKLFREVEKDGPISIHALKGVVSACERDGNSEDAVSVLFSAIDKGGDETWLVTNDESTYIFSVEPGEERLVWSKIVGEVLLSVIRNCNAAGRFGTALLCSRLVDVALFSLENENPQLQLVEAERVNEDEALEGSSLPLVFGSSVSEEMLVAMMVSLCGVGCSHHAVKLCEMSLGVKESTNDVGHLGPSTRWSDAEECYQYALSLSTESDLALGRPWESAHRHIHRITAAVSQITNSGKSISPEQRECLASAVERAMQCCTAAGHSDTGFHLGHRVQDVVFPSSSERGVVSTFLGLKTWSGVSE